MASVVCIAAAAPVGSQALSLQDLVVRSAEGADEFTTLLRCQYAMKNRHQHIDTAFNKGSRLLSAAART